MTRTSDWSRVAFVVSAIIALHLHPVFGSPAPPPLGSAEELQGELDRLLQSAIYHGGPHRLGAGNVDNGDGMSVFAGNTGHSTGGTSSSHFRAQTDPAYLHHSPESLPYHRSPSESFHGLPYFSHSQPAGSPVGTLNELSGHDQSSLLTQSQLRPELASALHSDRPDLQLDHMSGGSQVLHLAPNGADSTVWQAELGHPYHAAGAEVILPTDGQSSQAVQYGSAATQQAKVGNAELNSFLGSYRVILQTDLEVTKLITEMRFRVWLNYGGEEKVAEYVMQYPADLQGAYLSRPDTIALKVFSHRAHAKEILLLGKDGPRRLLFTFSSRPDFLIHKYRQGFVGVWELEPSQGQDVLPLHLRGFYKFEAEVFSKLELQPEATGREFWMMARLRPGTDVSAASLDLMVTRMRRNEAGSLESSLPSTQAQQHLQSTRFSEMFNPNRQVLGQHLYVYRESLQVALLTREWAKAAGLKAGSFDPIELNGEQIQYLSTHIDLSFRLIRKVKMVDLPTGGSLMLCFHQRLFWLVQHSRNIVSIWTFGPVVRDARVLTAVGFFNVPRLSWDKLTPEKIRGLRDSEFQYNMLSMP